jgi:uncharacterized membrane protein YeaQ/YmgE (transglycosylase-associated protein family)
MNTYLFCAIGAVLGVLASFMVGDKTPVTRIESAAVGIFGAFAGGELLYSLLGKPGGESNLMPMALAIGTSVLMLVVLALFRGAVGPMRSGKAKSRNR